MDDQTLAERLRACGISPTRQRLRIAGILLSGPQHRSAEQVMAEVNREGPAISKATVYNTLRLFTERGLLREVIVDPNRVYYDSTVRSHHHFYNPATGELTDIASDGVVVSGLPDSPRGTEPFDVEVIVRLRDRAGGRGA